MPVCLIALGANIGEKEQNVRRAIELLGDSDSIEVLRKSRTYQTAPVGGPDGQDSFANAAVLCETRLSPGALLQYLLEIEIEFGRQRDVRWQARTLDLDVLLYDDLVVSDEKFVLPHPRMSFRRFVLEPCAEIAPDMVHPVTQMSIGQLLDAINHRPALIALHSESRSAAIRLAHRVCIETNSILFCPGQKLEQDGENNNGFSESSIMPVKGLAEFSAWEQLERFLSNEELPSASDPVSASSRPAPHVICMEIAGKPKQLNHRPLLPRLAVAMFDCQGQPADRVQLKAKQRLLSNYHGPILVVDVHDLDSAAIELAAAIEAMR